VPGDYRIDILLRDIPEAAGVALLHEIAELLVEHDLATREDADEVRAVVELRPWTAEPLEPGAIDTVTPRAIPRSPDLGLGFNPN
jgi:hypothetical protein